MSKTNVLDTIITRKRQRLQEARVAQSLESLRELARAARRIAPGHALRRALNNKRANVIAEIKRASPSKGEIRNIADVAALASAYERSGAAAISVVTEEDHFGGSLHDLRCVVNAVSVPVLRKDFIVDEYQVYESAAAGADAVLLIVAALNDQELSQLRRLIEDELGMDALVEVHSSEEMRRANSCGATLIGVNNRDLRTFEVSLSTSVALAQNALPNVVLVSESGISSKDELLRLSSIGYKGFLIGESLLRSDDPPSALLHLLQDASSSNRVKVKICGITNLKDALSCVEAGADMLGFNFYHDSPRYIAPEDARRIIDQLPDYVTTVGIFVNEESPSQVASIAEVSGVDAVQLHGDESPEYCKTLDYPFVIKALRVASNFDVTQLRQYQTDAILLDSFNAYAYGGSGSCFDWSLGQQAKRFTQRLILAGGLTPMNVADAIEAVQPYAVDVCSSVEARPGIKDETLVSQFISAAKQQRPAPKTTNNHPDARGYWGQYGGRYVPETLMSPLEELSKAYEEALIDPQFDEELRTLLRDYSGRPTPLFLAERLTKHAGGARIYLKREDLSHTGSHKINNALGQVLLARRMRKHRVIAETGAGQHGVAVATVCALFDLKCVVYMGKEDMRRQALNVFRMQLMGAEVRAVGDESATLKEAINESLRDWVANVRDTYYLLGSATGPHPYPTIVRQFQSVIGDEARKQILEAERRLPEVVVACVGGGSNSIGLFQAFIDDQNVKLIGVEAGGHGLRLGQHASRISSMTAKAGVLHGAMSYVLQNDFGQIAPTHSISAGLDYPAIGPEHAFLHDTNRASYVSVSDADALAAFQTLSKLEGIVPALESAHAIAYTLNIASKMRSDETVIVNLSGRGDKDVETVASQLEEQIV